MLVCVYKTLSYSFCTSTDAIIFCDLNEFKLYQQFNSICRIVLYSISRLKYLESDSRQMVLDLLIWIRTFLDRTLSFRSSCCEGVCGSCAMLINNMNTLACIQPIWLINSYIVVYPLPHFNIIRDIVIDLKHFYEQYTYICPYYNLLDSSGFGDSIYNISLFTHAYSSSYLFLSLFVFITGLKFLHSILTFYEYKVQMYSFFDNIISIVSLFVTYVHNPYFYIY